MGGGMQPTRHPMSTVSEVPHRCRVRVRDFVCLHVWDQGHGTGLPRSSSVLFIPSLYELKCWHDSSCFFFSLHVSPRLVSLPSPSVSEGCAIRYPPAKHRSM